MATSKEQPTTPRGNGEVTIGWYVVALVDFLGQSSELAKWDFVPDDTGTEAWVPAVRKTYGRVLRWRKEFNQRYAAYVQNLLQFDDRYASSVPVELRRQFVESGKTTIHKRHFSDTLMVYSPLQNKLGYWQISNVLGMIAACGAFMLGGLCSGTPFRGAIEAGVLTHFPADPDGCPGDPYGPALAKAHYLESKIADYPRIVVGPGVLRYLDWLEGRPGHDALTETNRDAAKLCRGYIAKDADGRWIVDYLNQAFATAGGRGNLRSLQEQAFAFVQSELGRFRQEEDEKLTKRYERLEAYFRRHGST